MDRTINLNADVAEGFGAYAIGDDAGVLASVASANLACGFHGGDAVVMRRVVAMARARGVSVGAHPGFNDLWGFGRRAMEMGEADIETLVAYQIGALQGVAALCGVRPVHVKPHGALYTMAARRPGYAAAIGRAIKRIDPALILVGPPGSAMARAAADLDLAYVAEGFCDRLYDDDGGLVARDTTGAVLEDAGAATRQALDLALRGRVTTRSGKEAACAVGTLCVHGDTPGAAGRAAAVRAGLEAAGVRIVTLERLAR